MKAGRCANVRSWRSALLGSRGFSLIELVMVIMITSIISGFVSFLLIYGLDTYEHIGDRQEVLHVARLAIQNIERDIRLVKNSSSILAAHPDSLRFLNLNDATIQYVYQNSVLSRNDYMLAPHVSAFEFSYLDGNGALLGIPITDPEDIRRIAVTITVSRDDQTYTLATEVTPRNM